MGCRKSEVSCARDRQVIQRSRNSGLKESSQVLRQEYGHCAARTWSRGGKGNSWAAGVRFGEDVGTQMEAVLRSKGVEVIEAGLLRCSCAVKVLWSTCAAREVWFVC